MGKLFRRADFGTEVSTTQGAVLTLASGAPRVIVATSSLNFDGLAPEQQLSATQAFRDLLNAQSGPFQLYLRVRRVPPEKADEPDPAHFDDRRDYLAALTRSFINAHLDETPVYQRQTFITLAAFDGGGPLLRSWRYRFDRGADGAVSVGTDSGNQVLERNAAGTGEANNTASVTVASALGGPDLQVSNLRLDAVAGLQSGSAVVVYKGPDTLVAEPGGRIGFAPRAHPWLASAGTGDVLAGLIAAMRARGLPAFEAACAGVWLHGRAAEIAGPAMIADDLAAAIPAAIASL